MASTTSVEQLTRVWSSPVGLSSLKAVNHRTIGMRYIVTAFSFFLAGGVLALTMLIQLSRSGNNVLSPEMYNQFFTMHGTTMMFLFAVPVMEGIGIYIVPLMIGARDAAFPRLNAFGYFVFLIAGLTLYVGLFMGQAPDAGWFNYVPLAGPIYSPGLGIDLYVTAITFLEIAALVAAIELIVTIFKLRAPGMSMSRLPLFVWAILVMAFMIVFAMPPLVVTSVMLALDRLISTHFFNVAMGGNVLLWQHLFWWFGHPEVYIVAVPAFGMVSAVIGTMTRRPVVAYLAIVLSTIAIGIVSFGLWVHHMFSAGVPQLGMSFFAAASMSISIPSGIQVFAWIGTIWLSRRLIWTTSFLYIAGFVVLFLLGGITGVMTAAVPFDWQVHDSHFVTAHFHYVLIGGSVFPLIGALYMWWPKMTGRMLDEKLGKISFVLTFVGFNLAFLIMHYTGLIGMPRRVHSYMADRGWELPMLITVIGAFIMAAGFITTLVNCVRSLSAGRRAPADPWGGSTLEWLADSPPAPYNFHEIPNVRSRQPLWDPPPTADAPEVVYALGESRRETIGTSWLDGQPEQRILLPGPSIWPLLLAVSVGITFIGSVVQLIFVPIGAVLSAICIAGWNWPRPELRP